MKTQQTTVNEKVMTKAAYVLINETAYYILFLSTCICLLNNGLILIT